MYEYIRAMGLLLLIRVHPDPSPAAERSCSGLCKGDLEVLPYRRRELTPFSCPQEKAVPDSSSTLDQFLELSEGAPLSTSEHVVPRIHISIPLQHQADIHKRKSFSPHISESINQESSFEHSTYSIKETIYIVNRQHGQEGLLRCQPRDASRQADQSDQLQSVR